MNRNNSDRTVEKKRIRFIRIYLILIILISLLFNGCGEKKAYRVGILCGLDYMSVVADGFKQKMTDLGYIEGKNIIYDVQRPKSYMEDIDRISKKFVDDKVDLIFCFPTEAALGAKKATEGTAIPVVFAVTNIEKTDIVQSIREPGGNITGVRYPGPDLAIKRFDIMQQLAPQAKRYLIPYNPDLPVCYPQLEVLHTAAKKAGITLIEAKAHNAEEIGAFLKQRDEAPDFDAILFIAESLSVTPDAFLVMNKFAVKHRIPVGGALMATNGYSSIFGVNIKENESGTLAATFADKILKGTKAGTIPVVSDESYFELNYNEAKKLGLDVSEGLLTQANKVIR
jgi:putative ABC transport system substrate-binding protein